MQRLRKSHRKRALPLIGLLVIILPLNLKATEPVVIMETNKGTVHIALDENKAKKTTANFLNYVNKGFYNDTIFHRVIPGFMVQGGGFTADMTQKTTDTPIKNEAGNGLSNRRGTIAMARTSDPDSANSQFFINLVDNPNLDRSDKGAGYAVFGRVVKGIEVIDAIAQTPTRRFPGTRHQNVPIETIVINKMTVQTSAAAATPTKSTKK